jgi:serine/tyrosine/threonine adenylyltransferase
LIGKTLGLVLSQVWAPATRQRASLIRGAGCRYAKANPVFIPRNHLVEAALGAAVGHQDFQAFEELSDVVSHPYQEQPGLERYATPARPEEGVRWTFCGT